MNDIVKRLQAYNKLDVYDISSNEKNEIYHFLKEKVLPEHLENMEEHKLFLDVLANLRTVIKKDDELKGKHYSQWEKTQLTVGKDGMYSDEYRFLDELIQNVDDCEYKSIEDCKLEIRFEFKEEPGKIILTYNEKGFTPFNVFNITGIAEDGKNISSDKIEIGEKGIGFKSVFGIASKVYIESGKFSFALYTDNYTIPVPLYDNYLEHPGTRMTIEAPRIKVLNIYNTLRDKYTKTDTLLGNNPILFLNKLTNLKLYINENENIEFYVERMEPKQFKDILIEGFSVISININSLDERQSYHDEIKCKRYTMPIVYGKKECQARYGEDCPFDSRQHSMIALFSTRKNTNLEGKLYSFLPTKVKLTVPVLLHVPFKLNSSREYVDSNGEDLWFQYTVKKLSAFIEQVYQGFSQVCKANILDFLPPKGKNFFDINDDRNGCFRKREFVSDSVLSKKIFLSTDGTYENVDNILSIPELNNNPEEAVKIHKLLNKERKLFLYDTRKNRKPSEYGISIIENVPKEVFENVISNGKNIEPQMKWLNDNLDIDKIADIIHRHAPFSITEEQYNGFLHHTNLREGLYSALFKCLKEKKLPNISLAYANFIKAIPPEVREELINGVEKTALDEWFKNYLQKINYKFLSAEISSNRPMPYRNCVILSAVNPKGSFASLAESFDKYKIFTAALHIEAAERELDNEFNTLSPKEYLQRLCEIRGTLKNNKILAKSIKNFINESGKNKNNFLNELLQNADDCKFDDNDIPSFILERKENTLQISINEKGFEKKDVKGITSIGESTKLEYQESKESEIGEKGIGFKTVFGVARKVDIHSGPFHFRLLDKSPLIPEILANSEEQSGTIYILDLKEDVSEALKKSNILRLCICLRKLKRIKILDTEIKIEDSGNKRVVTINGVEYSFRIFDYKFQIPGDLLKDRQANNKKIRANIIRFLVPEIKTPNALYLYSGLPTQVKCLAPVIIDVPFDLTASRENVIQNLWNNYLKQELYNGILQLMMVEKDEMRIEVLRYVNPISFNQNRVFSLFSEDYLNPDISFTKKLMKTSFLPVLGNKTEYVSILEDDCILVPEIIADILTDNSNLSAMYDGEIIDVKGKKYVSILRNLKCQESKIRIDIQCISYVVKNKIKNDVFRNKLYNFLEERHEDIDREHLLSEVLKMPIFPIRTQDGTEYVEYSNKIYLHDIYYSNEDYLILDVSVLNRNRFLKIVGYKYHINLLTNDVINANYREKIKEYLQQNKSHLEKARYILREYTNNFKQFKAIRSDLCYMASMIPLKMQDGSYRVRNRFHNNEKQVFYGNLIKQYIISEEYKDLAIFLNVTEDIMNLRRADLDLSGIKMQDYDLDDLQKLNYGYSIIGILYSEGKIPDNYMVEKHLEFLYGRYDSNEFDDEEFPVKSVKDMPRLKNHIKKEFEQNPNPYVTKMREIREPKYETIKNDYLANMYGSNENRRKCFCQMCKKKYDTKYFERNNILKEPTFEWSQLYLNLCLNCSKDYKELRYNNTVWEKFIMAIKNKTVDYEGIMEVPIGDRIITFTGIHLAEIKAIFDIEKH